VTLAQSNILSMHLVGPQHYYQRTKVHYVQN